MRYGFARKVDTGSKQLVQAARELGFTVILCGGKEIDAIFVKGGKVLLVDFKRSAKAKKTARQLELDRLNVPIHYIHSTAQLLELVKNDQAVVGDRRVDPVTL